MEMFEVVADGLQPYIHACQNQLLKTLRALRESKQASTPNTSITYDQTYNRTDVNIQHWGPPLLLALQEITEKKQQNIPVNEIKQTMAKYANRFDKEKISNDGIGYMLRRLRLTNSYGRFSCQAKIAKTGGSHSWYAIATKTGFTSGTSST